VRVLGGELAHQCDTGASRTTSRDSYRNADLATLISAHAVRSDNPLAEVSHLSTPDRRAYHFFAATSFISSISMSRSATSFFSFAFSCLT
jgi:hypothetical protein